MFKKVITIAITFCLVFSTSTAFSTGESEHSEIHAALVAEGAAIASEIRTLSNSEMQYTGGSLVWLEKSYDEVYSFRDDRALVSKDEKYGFIDKDGKEVVPLIYDESGMFWEGLAVAKKDGKYGFIDKTENIIIPFSYDNASSFIEGRAIIGKGDEYDEEGILINGKYGYIDKAGNEVIPLTYDDAGSFTEGLAIVSNDEKYGFIDKEGNEVIPLIYDWVEGFFEGLAFVIKDGKWGFIDKEGDEIVPVIFDLISGISEDIAIVEKDERKGIFRLNPQNQQEKIEAVFNTSKVLVDGEEVAFDAYTIEDNNYFKLRDVAEAFDIGVTWDEDTGTIGIDTGIGYR